MQEREFPTVLSAVYLATGHLRQHPLHFFRVYRSATWCDVVGVADLVWGGDPDIRSLINARHDYETVTHIVIPAVEDAIGLVEWAGGPLAKSVNALCHGGNSLTQVQRVVCAFAEFVPVLVPLVGPEERPPNDPLFNDQTESGSSPSRVLAGASKRIVKCRLAKREMPPGPADAVHLPPELRARLSGSIAGITFRETFSLKSAAARDRLEREVAELEAAFSLEPAPAPSTNPIEPMM